jgi:hypothetical protein
MLAKPAPTDQRAGVRPISFVLDDAGALSPPVTLSIRPEDLSRSEPLRATVHQTLGRDVAGWVDSFGRGLPSVNISGHTGWRYANGSGLDGAQSFDALNQLVAHDFPEAQQQAIERGIDPGLVQLLLIDMLDGFAYSVIPTQFVLRRNKSRPLLYQYQISLQATATEIDTPVIDVAEYGSFPAGLTSLDAEVDFLTDQMFDLEALIRAALAFAAPGSVTLAQPLIQLLSLAVEAAAAAGDAIRSAPSFSVGSSSPQAAVAADLARSGTNILRTLTAIQLLPSVRAADLVRVASHFNTVVCLFSNSLRDRQKYEDYSPLYGSSGCSSTTGGGPASRYLGTNTFAAIDFGARKAMATSEALASIAALSTMDPVLSPMSLQEIVRHARVIFEGLKL